MSSFARTFIAATIIAAAAFVVAYSAATEREAGTQNAVPTSLQSALSDTELLGATQWASFVAEIQRTEGGRDLVSRYYQNSSGSRRTEASSPDQKERVVTIHNLERRTSYFQGPGGDWAMLPLITGFREQPNRIPKSTAGLSLSPEEPRLGFKVYLYVSKSGRRSLLAPDLNLLSMLSDDGGSHREEVIAVKMEESAADLFYPPATASVRQATSITDLLRARTNGR